MRKRVRRTSAGPFGSGRNMCCYSASPSWGRFLKSRAFVSSLRVASKSSPWADIARRHSCRMRLSNSRARVGLGTDHTGSKDSPKREYQPRQVAPDELDQYQIFEKTSIRPRLQQGRL